VPPPVAPEETRKRKLEVTDDHQRKKSSGAAKGKDWTGKPNEMDRLAQGLQKLQEDDLLQVVRIVTEHKTPEMYVKNDLEGMFPLPDFLAMVLIDRG
jgi:transcription initiation factor TFIID/TFIIF subunit